MREKQEKTVEMYCTTAPANTKWLSSFSAAVREPAQPEANDPLPLCHSLVRELVNQCLGDCLDSISQDLLDNIIGKLRQCLLEELEGCDVPDRSSGLSIPAIVTAASRELQQTIGPKEALETALLLQRNKDYRIFSRTLKKHLCMVQRSMVTVLLNKLLSVGRAGLLCCFILPDEDDEEIIVCSANNDGKVLNKQSLLPTLTKDFPGPRRGHCSEGIPTHQILTPRFREAMRVKTTKEKKDE